MINWIILCSMITQPFNPITYLEDLIKNDYLVKIDQKKLEDYVNVISSKIENQKGVYTILITLCLYKINNPSQDIRYHKKDLENGFSGRTYDTNFVTPTLKKFALPSMSESGYLTRSLEQQAAYDLNYPGKISDKEVKEAFLNIIDIFQKKPKYCRPILIYLINAAKIIKKSNYIEIKKIKKENKFTVNELIKIFNTYFYYKFGVSGGSKIPVICFYTLINLLMKQNIKYSSMTLKKLGFHTTSDLTSKSAGDIEIFHNDKCYEAFEIKFEHIIDEHMINIACPKIIKFNPQRYYILTTSNVKNNVGETLIQKIRNDHGCEIVIGNYFDFLEKYLFMLEDLNIFINNFSINVQQDKELKIIHKKIWMSIIAD
jgi:DNA (cytosine-5)-methyltransferase 1